MAGEFMVMREGLGLDPDIGHALFTNSEGTCPNCCDGQCRIFWCGCGTGVKNMLAADQTYIGLSTPRRMRIPEFWEFGGACSQKHIYHPMRQNIGDELQDVITIVKFNCDGDGTGTFLVKTVIYDGNNPDRMVNNQWRFGGYIDMTDRDQPGRGEYLHSAFPFLENKPSYNATTTRLSVEIKWCDEIYGDSFFLDVAPSEEMDGQDPFIRNIQVSFVSWSGGGAAAFNATGGFNGTGRLTVTEAPTGISSGTAIFELSHPNMESIQTVVQESGSRPGRRIGSLRSYCMMDFPHTVLGTDTEGITFDSNNIRCGMCTEGQEIEIDFDTGYSEFTALILPTKGNQKGVGGSGGGLGNYYWYLNEYWCGCGSEPWSHLKPNTYSVSAGSINSFWVRTERDNQNFSHLFPDPNVRHHPMDSAKGGQYGWASRDNLLYRFIRTEFDDEGDRLENAYEANHSSPYGKPTTPINGYFIRPLVQHEYHDDPYVRDRTEYNARRNAKLGVVAPLAVPIREQWPDYESYSYLESRRVEVEFDFKLHYVGNKYWSQWIPDQDLLDGIDTSHNRSHKLVVYIAHAGALGEPWGFPIHLEATYEDNGNWQSGATPGVKVGWGISGNMGQGGFYKHDEFVPVKYIGSYQNETVSEFIYAGQGSSQLPTLTGNSVLRNFYYFVCGGISIFVNDKPYRQAERFFGDGGTPDSEPAPFKARPTFQIKNLRIQYYNNA